MQISQIRFIFDISKALTLRNKNLAIMKTLENFKNLELPCISKSFLEKFDGTPKSLLDIDNLSQVLNPFFSGSYYYISGDTSENLITSKDIGDLPIRRGSQSEVAENNAYELADLVKEIIKSFDLKYGKDIFTVKEMKSMNTKYDRIAKRAFIKQNNEWVNIKGLTVNSFGLTKRYELRD